VAQPSWQQELSRLSWSALYRDGPALLAYLAAERAEFVTVLGDLGLLKMPATSV
jgi:tripartite-type tricarboxylate transporter receptor subunit TctC